METQTVADPRRRRVAAEVSPERPAPPAAVGSLRLQRSIAVPRLERRLRRARGAVGGGAPDRPQLRPVVVDRVGPGGVRPAPQLQRRRRAVVEAVAGHVHDDVRAVRRRRADAVGDHGPRRRPARPRRGVPARRRCSLGVVAGGCCAGLRSSAGLIAAVGVVLTQEWSYYMFRGTSEPMLSRASLWAVDRHLAGRHAQAFAVRRRRLADPPGGVAVHLPLRDLAVAPRAAAAACCSSSGWLSIPFLWFVPPWIGTGQPFLAASHAKDYNGHLGKHPFLEVLRRGVDLQVAADAGARARGRRARMVARAATGWCSASAAAARAGGCSSWR